MASEWIETIVNFAKANEEWILPIAFAVSASEAIIGVSIFIPSTAIFIVLASVGGFAGQNLIALWLAVGVGAAVGDWLSYLMGYYFEGPLRRTWPLSRRPQLIDEGRVFFERWGLLSLFVCRFLYTARPVVMLTAGIVRMPQSKFIAATLVSALFWAAIILTPVTYGARWLSNNL